tara:strand:+ start:902 stop:1039 length:138 start_codon:yes stop_codon:yes gene_type:complete
MPPQVKRNIFWFILHQAGTSYGGVWVFFIVISLGSILVGGKRGQV